MRSALFAAVVFLVAFPASAQAPKSAQPTPPKRGEAVTVEANQFEAGLATALMNERVRVADPESKDFDSPCQLVSPLTLSVVGADADLVLARLMSQPERSSECDCRSGSLVMLSPNAWRKLKSVEARVKAAVDAKTRVKAKIRLMLKLDETCKADPKRPECGK